MLTKDKKILIVGLGLMGGSYAQALKRQGFTVDAITRSQGSIDYALERGWIDWGSTTVDPVELGTCDLVIFALYPNVLLRWLEDNQRYLKDGALLTDVTGIKGPVVYKVQAMLRPALEFVGAHPMAGREVYGVRNADCSIFQGANYIVTPTESNTPAAVEATEELGRLLGFARISRLSPERHDEMIGFLSQLTHCIAVALMTCRDVEHLSAYTGDSFRDLTRIARINDEMWSELFLLNRDKLLEQIDLFEAQMQILRKAIAQGDSELLRSLMRLSTSKRALFDK
ncbi:MAG: prephenate dehydrogenase [Bacteroidales bacterium]|nr:prephenate dehydrogenase [Bacteroidales bacterium]